MSEVNVCGHIHISGHNYPIIEINQTEYEALAKKFEGKKGLPVYCWIQNFGQKIEFNLLPTPDEEYQIEIHLD
jgi:hypothetical protein